MSDRVRPTWYCWEENGNWDSEEEPKATEPAWLCWDEQDAAEKYVEDIIDQRDGWENTAESWTVFVRNTQGQVFRIVVAISYERRYDAEESALVHGPVEASSTEPKP